MQIEVTEQNIILYGLVQLTGNSSEVLMARANEAKASGYILAVEVPDTDDIEINLFEHSINRTDADETIGNDPNPIFNDGVVSGEVVNGTDES